MSLVKIILGTGVLVLLFEPWGFYSNQDRQCADERTGVMPNTGLDNCCDGNRD